MQVEIKCPACESGMITVDPVLLASGASFNCNQCDAKISVSDNSKADLKKGVEKYQNYQEELRNLQDEGNNPQG